MTVKDALSQLESMSNETTRTHNIKYGADKNQFGVKMGDIRALAKKIKSDHALALELWATRNLDAQFLAVLIINPKALSVKDLADMARTISFVHVADWFNSYILKEYTETEKFREEWMNSGDKWLARCGWSLTAGKITRDAENLDMDKILDRIEAEMPDAPIEVQWTMNTALAQIGINHPKYRQRAIDIGEKLGIYRDYPVSKGCTSPFAPIWINEMVSRQK